MKVGLNLLIVSVHPMKPGATLMSSFLFNTALVLLATNAAIQFCSQAFALYANETSIQQIWGGQVRLTSAMCVPAARQTATLDSMHMPHYGICTLLDVMHAGCTDENGRA